MTDKALAEIAERFKRDTASHRLTVLHDDPHKPIQTGKA